MQRFCTEIKIDFKANLNLSACVDKHILRSEKGSDLVGALKVQVNNNWSGLALPKIPKQKGNLQLHVSLQYVY